MSDYEIEFYVFDGSSGSLGTGLSASGHVNATFKDNITGFAVSIGANMSSFSNGTAVRGLGATNDGVLQIENDKLEPGKYASASRSVPVTKEQFLEISQAASNLAHQNLEYDYALASGPDGKAQTCVTWAEAVYQMTGHPGTMGDLFSISDVDETPGLVWTLIGVNTAGIPVYLPSGPIVGHVPDVTGLILAGTRQDGDYIGIVTK